MAAGAALDLTTAILVELGSYASGKIQSAWLAKKDLQKMERSLDTIRPFIRDAEKKQSGSDAIKQWVKELKQVVYDIDDLLDEAATDALQLELKQHSRKVRNCLSYARHKVISPFILSNRMKEILDVLDEIKANASRLNLSLNLAETSHVVQSSNRIKYPLPFANESKSIKGREEAKREIVNRVLGNDVECSFGLSVLPIVGIGGLGKTTLAQLVYSDPDIKKGFDIRLWGCVSDPFNLESLLKRLLESVNIKDLGPGEMVEKLGSVVGGKRYFMVLDDVWTRNENEWNSLKEILAYGGAEGSVILATTRDKKVATGTIGAEKYYDLEKLPFHLCMSVFMENAFSDGEVERYPHLVTIGEAIVRKCGGVPLAVKTLGSSLRGERDEGKWRRIAENDLWNIEQKEGGIFAALKLSYNALGSQLKLCFAYLSVYPKDRSLYALDVISMWIAQGLIRNEHDEMEDVGHKYFVELLSRSLLQEPISLLNGRVHECQMHDLVHDLAMDVMGEELALVGCNNSNVSRFVRHIAWEGSADDLSEKKVGLPRQLIVRAQQVRTFKWNYSMGSIDKRILEQIISTFKWLRYLDLQSSEFEEIPDSIGRVKHLRNLCLMHNKSIKTLPTSLCKLLNLQSLSLNGCEQLEELPRDIGKLVNLRYLALTIKGQYLFPKGMKGFGNQPSLRVLKIQDCDELISLLPEEEEDGDEVLLGKIRFLTQLRVLSVCSCPKLSSLLSKSLVYLTALKELHILDCESLDWRVEWPPGPGLGGMTPNGLQRLEFLHVIGASKMVGLPVGLEVAALSLRYLCIDNCGGLTSLPDWLRNCKFLLDLMLCDCPRLSSTLPPQVTKTLQRLFVEGCAGLSLGSDVSHIPNVWIEGRDVGG